MAYPDNFNSAAFAEAWERRPSNGSPVQIASAKTMAIALATCADTIGRLEFPEGSPVIGYDVADIVEQLRGDFMPVGV